MATLKQAKRVAVIGAGPSGAITVDALVREKCFDVIRVFERREGPGGCWLDDKDPPPPLTNLLTALSTRTADPPLPNIPDTLPTTTAAVPPAQQQPRFAESSIYPYLETNVTDTAMRFSAEPIADERSDWSIAMHGADTPFRHWHVMRSYVQGVFSCAASASQSVAVTFGTSVERCTKQGDEWVLTLRKPTQDAQQQEEWWQERFDAVVVASGHFSVPYIPAIAGLEDFERAHPGSVLHSKMYRGRSAFSGKRVVVVGASVSAADIAYDLASHDVAEVEVHAITLGHTLNPYFGGGAFAHPRIVQHPSIARVQAATRTVELVDGSALEGVDYLIFGTGYSWSLPFLPQVSVRANRVPGLYQHVVYAQDPTLCFVGGVGAGLTFKIFEWQAVYAARLLAGRGRLPSKEEMVAWEEERLQRKGERGFLTVHPEYEEYFEGLRRLAGEPTAAGEGRRLPPWDEGWFDSFMEGHEKRKAMWKRLNALAREKMEAEVVVSQL